MKTITILGSTGSIGTQCLDIVAQHPNLFQINYLTTHSNTIFFEQQTAQFSPKGVVITEPIAYQNFIKNTNFKGKILSEEDGLLEAAADSNCDIVIVALVGFAGLKPTIKAIQNKKNIALANKEALVVGGQHIIDLARANNVDILPVDSEHSAIFQCLQGEKITNINKLILTASGGPFLKISSKEIKKIKSKDALNHPT